MPPSTPSSAAAVSRLADLLRDSRGASAASLPDGTEEGLLGAVCFLVARRLRVGEVERLPELAPELTELLLGPYLAVTAASGEAPPAAG